MVHQYRCILLAMCIHSGPIWGVLCEFKIWSVFILWHIKMCSCLYDNFHYADKTGSRLSYHHNGNPHTYIYCLDIETGPWYLTRPSISQYHVCVGVVFGSNIAAVVAVNHEKDHLWCSNTLYGRSGAGLTKAYKQWVLMHGHQGWNVRHGLCHIYMRYVYIYELFIAFVSFVVCSLL